jgi:hypothetical protein
MNAWNELVRAASTGALVTRDRKKESAEYRRAALPDVFVVAPVGPPVVVEPPVVGAALVAVDPVGVFVPVEGDAGVAAAGAAALACRAARAAARAFRCFQVRWWPASVRVSPLATDWLVAAGAPDMIATARSRAAVRAVIATDKGMPSRRRPEPTRCVAGVPARCEAGEEA